MREHQSWRDHELLDSNNSASTNRHQCNRPHSHRWVYWLSWWHQHCTEWTHSAIDHLVVVDGVCLRVCVSEAMDNYIFPSNVQPRNARTGLTYLGKVLTCVIITSCLSACQNQHPTEGFSSPVYLQIMKPWEDFDTGWQIASFTESKGSIWLCLLVVVPIAKLCILCTSCSFLKIHGTAADS